MSTIPKSMQALWQDAYLTSGSDYYIESLYETYLKSPDQVLPEWREYFNQLQQEISRNQPEVSHDAIRKFFLAQAKNRTQSLSVRAPAQAVSEKQESIYEIINAYRKLGHQRANCDPLNMRPIPDVSALDETFYGFTEADLNQSYSLGSYLSQGKSTATLRELLDSLNQTYCGSIGFEYRHINRYEEAEWLRGKIEQDWVAFKLDADEKRHILKQLVMADGFEKYLGFRFVGQKRFSLEGGDSLIPMLDRMVTRFAKASVKEVVFGMAHRGRLNVLANVIGKDTKEIFNAFEGKGISTTHSGDVKYHLGCSSTVVTDFGPMHLALSFNPSHLEIVSPVVQGSVRSRQRRRRDTPQEKVIPIQIHGDAAFAGQGCVMETFNMSQARWFMVGGSIHIVINNQVGFTTSNPLDARSTPYCTDVAKMIEAPILHVNSADPEAVIFAAQLAVDYRLKFKRDIVIDLVCYRRHGHNEADEPSATQPLMYQKIKSLPVPYMLYAEQLKEAGVITGDEPAQWAENYRTSLDRGDVLVKLDETGSGYEFNVNWTPFIGKDWTEPAETNITPDTFKRIAAKLAVLPDGFVVQPQVKKMLDNQVKMAAGEMPLNWGYAEALAYGSLLDQGYPIRLCGQDAARGTFAHRHAILHDQKTDNIYIPLSHISDKQAQINIVDSLLSEEAVLAFEYGYATAEPNYLTIWEAQFGDFANGAQVVIDQFISSGEQKWGRLCGLVMLLPHGYEGMGPEHSSARLERYLQLCAQNNMQVCVPSTPSQIFHLLRRQMIRTCRKPLIIMSPKSVLRHPLAVSTLDEITHGKFHCVLPEVDTLNPNSVTSVVLCSGKIYFELLEKRRTLKRSDVAILRIEQLYPFPETDFVNAMSNYTKAKDIVWCQEEPQNQGAWNMVKDLIGPQLKSTQTLRYAGRKSSASPAAGYHSVHELEQEALVESAFQINGK